MKNFILCITFISFWVQLPAQSITLQDGGGFCFSFDLLFQDIHNGRNRYEFSNAFFTTTIAWSGTQWEITRAGVLTYRNTSNLSPNPPCLGNGTWEDLDFCNALTILTGTGCQTILPVELVYLRAIANNEAALLTWQTATELINEGFEIQRAVGDAALEAGRWQVLAFVEGNGTTNEIQNYSYTDEHPQAGLNYYRLKQIDFDGKFEYSDVVSVQSAVGSPQLEVFPNPVRSDELTLYLPEANESNATIRLYDQTGKLAIQQTTSSQQETLNVSQLVAGIYFVEVTVGGKVFREKVVVE